MQHRALPFLTCVILFVLLTLLTSCGGQSGQSQQQATTTAGPSVGQFANPVIRSDFADPDIFHSGKTYYAYATNAFGKNIQAANSQDLVHWNMLDDALPVLPTWAKPSGSSVWAPEVIGLGNKYVMYYTARDQQSDKQCVGVATSDKPDGRFKDTSDHALVCQTDQGGTIDPSPLLDGNTLYLYFKNDGNCCAQPTNLYAQQLSADGLSVVGTPTQLIRNDQTWEGNVVEAPQMFQHNGKYYLFYSGGNYADSTYAVGYAACQSATGPCEQATENPILASRLQKQPFVIGPGGESVFQVGNQTWIAYHSWQVNSDGSRGDSRFMDLDQLTWENDKPHVQGPKTDPETVPQP